MTVKTRKKKKVFKEGAIQPSFIAKAISNHQVKTNIGAHDIFLGQVRDDQIDDKKVTAIDYTAYEEMAEEVFNQIREETFNRFDLVCMHIYHSLGVVRTGEICLFVFVSAAHRKAAFQALQFVVEQIKTNVPIFGKEILEDVTYQWKQNS